MSQNIKSQALKQFHDGTTYKLWSVCGCGCDQVVRDRFAQGHDMKTPVQKDKGR